MFDGEIDTDHIMAMCAHTPVPRIFIINQILSIQIYDALSQHARELIHK